MATPKRKAPAGRKRTPAAATRSANPERGEHTAQILGKKYLLRPSYSAQIAIEQRTGRSYTELAMDGQSGALKLDHLGIIVAEMVNAGADGPLQKVSDERMAEMIYEEGMPQIAAVATVAIIDALTGGRTSKGEAKAAVA